MITDLPLNGRNILQLVAVTPGTLNASSSSFNQGASFNYVLPYAAGKTAMRYLLGGWQANGIVGLQTGGPLTISSGIDDSRSGIGLDGQISWAIRHWREGGRSRSRSRAGSTRRRSW